MGRLPARRLEAFQRLRVRVSAGATIRVARNTYSVHSRLIGEQVDVRLHADQLELWYAQRCLERIPRLRGEGRHHIQYRHIIDWLVRKPGAFEGYRYRQDLFPSSRFRIVYDRLGQQHSPAKAAKQYLLILELAATGTESVVDQVLGQLIEQRGPISADGVTQMVTASQGTPSRAVVKVAAVQLDQYEALLGQEAV